jgi:outer membrane biosynthesis protein TonB
MAHASELPGARAAILAAGLALALGARAATLGELTVRSAPGASLLASIAIDLPAGKRFDADCIFLSQGPAGSGPYLTKARIGIEAQGAARILHILGSEPAAPGAKLRVIVRCPGEERFTYRQYSALFAPAATPLAPVALPGASALTPQLPLLTAGFPVLAGDSLHSLAAAIFPGDSAARDAYVEALRAANPPLAGARARDPLPAGSRLALPDLRAIPRVSAPRPATASANDDRPRTPKTEAPQPPSVRRQARAVEPPPTPPPPVAATPPPARPAPAETRPAVRAPAPPPRAEAGRSSSPFVLRLSAPELDLGRTKGMDEKSRARLRDRQLVLDVDDQVAAFLALRDSVRKLETRVAELQLKLSTVPSTPAPAPVAAAPARVQPPMPAPAVPPPEVAPKPRVEPAPAAPPAEAAKPAAPVAAPPAAARPAPPPPAPKASAPAPAESAWPDEWLWGGLAVSVVVVAALAAWLFRRRRRASEQPATPTRFPPTMVLDERPGESADSSADAGPVDVASPEPVRTETIQRRVIGSDASLATEVRAGDPAAVRRRYIEERFPEIANRAIALDDPDSVVKGARLFYEDGAIARAVELLQYATEEKPAEMAPWLALFEIYRLEGLSGQYAELARRFKEAHGKSQSWKKVQYFGRAFDADNSMYQDASMGIDTIRFDAGKPPVAQTYDPVAENWLKAPMDFQNEVFATELRRALMGEAGITEESLAPNPMPALRSVEMFTVA